MVIYNTVVYDIDGVRHLTHYRLHFHLFLLKFYL